MKKREELLKKLERILALYRNPTTPGEKEAAARAVQRIQERLASLRHYEPTIREYKFPVFTKH
jgi:hypothetical protein